MDTLWPYLSEPKREQAAAAFADRAMFLALPRLPRPPQCCRRERCKRGHLLAVTRYVAPGGGSYCRECAKLACRRWRRKDAPLFNGAAPTPAPAPERTLFDTPAKED
jgi:hypothetical protein